MALKQLSLSLQFSDLKNAARHRAALPRHSVARWIRHALAHDGEITVRIVDAEEGQLLNRDYRLRDYATNVLTFDYTQQPVVTADLVLCAPVVAKEAKDNKKTLQAHYAHLLVHGTLHDHRPARQVAPGSGAHRNAIRLCRRARDGLHRAGGRAAMQAVEKIEDEGDRD